MENDRALKSNNQYLIFVRIFSAALLNRFEICLPLLSVESIDLVDEVITLKESFGHVMSRSCSRNFSMIFATITDGLACGGPIKLNHIKN